jgi:hypothetical protein
VRTLAWIVGFVGWSALCFAAFHWAFGPGPVWAGAVSGAIVGLSVLGLMEAQRRGWIRGWWPSSRDADEARQRLAKERDDILAAARAKARSQNADAGPDAGPRGV